jgi:O-antigen/teichoic acid export membrane protein
MLWVLSDNVFRLILGFTVNILLIRYLGPLKLGVLGYAQSLVALFIGFAHFGIEDVIIRHLISKNLSLRTIHLKM